MSNVNSNREKRQPADVFISHIKKKESLLQSHFLNGAFLYAFKKPVEGRKRLSECFLNRKVLGCKFIK